MITEILVGSTEMPARMFKLPLRTPLDFGMDFGKPSGV